MKNLLLTAAGCLLLGLGAVGLVLPVWPTTPFVLLACGCFSASARMRQGLMRIRFFKEHYENYTGGAGLSSKTLTRSIGSLWGMLFISAVLAGELWICLLLAAVGAAVTAHLLIIAKPRRERGGRKSETELWTD